MATVVNRRIEAAGAFCPAKWKPKEVRHLLAAAATQSRRCFGLIQRQGITCGGRALRSGALAAHERELAMRIATTLGLGVLGLLFILPAQALTISNTDSDSHTITVKTGSGSTELVVEPDMAVEPPCTAGCTVELENGEQYEMKGGEEISIEGGVIFVDTVPGSEDEDEGTAALPDEPSDAASQDSASAPAESSPQAQ
jgi:hypothetical protein